MSLFFYKEVKRALILFVLGGILLLGILIPLNQLLPDFFDSWVPDFLVDKSILFYLQGHFNFFIITMPAVGLVVMILFLWRRG